MTVGNGKHSRYMSFKGTDTNNRIGYLHLNKITNVKAKYNILERVSIIDEVYYKGKKGELCDFLLEIKNGTILLFIRVEQGSGRHKNNVLVISIPRNRMEAQR